MNPKNECSRALKHDEKDWYFGNKEFRNCYERKILSFICDSCHRLHFLGFIEMIMLIVNVYMNKLLIYINLKTIINDEY